ncbi:MAG: HTH domain-containing protein, partial [Nanoarchaeota archaeon]|nr:HTH domain-containing protein [Nanoarchaeota archaeon]
MLRKVKRGKGNRDTESIESFKYAINNKLIVVNKMVISHNLSKKIMLILLKDFCSEHTVTSLAKRLSVSRVGIWKALRKLESEELIILEQIGNGRTSVYRIRLNWKNVLTERELSLYLTQEALRQKRWRWDFCELERNIDFTLLFGSILTLPKKA